MIRKLIAVFFVVGVLFPLMLGRAQIVANKKAALKSPLAPQEAVKHFQLAPGLRIELAACEPQIESPVAMAFDEDGRLWVVEMRDYPNGPPKGQLSQGRIRILEDRDGDGFFERSRLFADNLLFANGLLPWKGGVIVTAAPHIVYLKDTDGDGKADLKEVWYEGFATQNPQLRVSHPILGLDGWIYVANGLRGGMVKSAKLNADQKPINLAGMDFRFDPITAKHEAISGLGQFGNTFDDWGNRFVCDNRHHLRHVVIENRYLKRNPYLAAPGVVEDISILDDGPLSSGGKIYPISSNWTTSNLHEGRFTAACGVFIYRERLLGQEYRGCAFTCDPTGNLVHQEALKQNGATFEARPVWKDKEFLASPDDWFRPVFLSSGPDGALYVVDMYRAVIEHPEFMPPELKNRPDLELGKDKGRIWRIVPEDHKANGPRLSKRTTEQLVEHLKSPDAWWRTTAQRLLLEQQDHRRWMTALRPLLKDQPHAVVTAAWLLQRLGVLTDNDVHDLLEHPSPRVREHALLWAESRLARPTPLLQGVLACARDADPRVRFQAALTLGAWDDWQRAIGLAHVADLGSDDRWTRLAVASAAKNRAARVFHNLRAGPATPGRLLLAEELAALVGAADDTTAMWELLKELPVLKELPKESLDRSAPWLLAGCNGFCSGLARRGKRAQDVLQTLPAESKLLKDKFASTLTELAATAGDQSLESGMRLGCTRLLSRIDWSHAKPVLSRLLTQETAQELRLAAVRAASAHALPEATTLLMAGWHSHTPAVRREVTEAMMRDPARIQYLLDEIAAQRVRPADLDALRTRQLVNHPRAEIRERARRLLAENMPADRRDVLARYQKALELKGDAKNGREVFKKNCATCHRVAGIGTDVGPDVSDTRTKTFAALLTDILNPNQAIDNNYVNYLVQTKSGKSLSGIIVAETASSITLRRAEAQSDVILRQDIDEIQSTGVSLMPDGLEKTITVSEMADLLTFLKNWRYLDGAVPVGQ